MRMLILNRELLVEHLAARYDSDDEYDGNEYNSSSEDDVIFPVRQEQIANQVDIMHLPIVVGDDDNDLHRLGMLEEQQILVEDDHDDDLNLLEDAVASQDLPLEAQFQENETPLLSNEELHTKLNGNAAQRSLAQEVEKESVAICKAECVICQDNLYSADPTNVPAVLKCGHCYHTNCISKWLVTLRNRTCVSFSTNPSQFVDHAVNLRICANLRILNLKMSC